MFEVGFSEMLVIMALALVVLGPEKLPKLAAQVGRWLGRARNMARQFREQLEEEAILEETRPKPRTAAATAAAATATATASAAAATVPPAPADPAPSDFAAAASPPDATDDADTRHNDYAGATWEPPANTPDTDPDPVSPVTTAAATEDTDRVGRGA
jgi:sec-independent protein translocase protein TatB